MLHLFFQLRPALSFVRYTKDEADFASYYYAVQVAATGQDPYETPLLDQAAQRDNTRRQVFPYFYPPPFLLSMVWALPLSLRQASLGMLALNEGLLLCSVIILLRSFAVSPWAVTLVLATFTPIAENARMGQANLFALMPALAGLALAGRRPIIGGGLVGLAAIFKMSPALLLLPWILQKRWKPLIAAITAAGVLTIVSLPLVAWPHQLRFYSEVLPGFAAGSYHGLDVPLTLNANHSIPDLFNRMWPGRSAAELSQPAQYASRVTALLLLGAWALWFRRPSETPAIAALTVLMVIIPAFTFEHHLILLLLPILVAATAGPWWLFFPFYLFLALPLDWFRAVQRLVPGLAPLFRESKFLAEIVMLGLCAWLGRPGAPPWLNERSEDPTSLPATDAGRVETSASVEGQGRDRARSP
jgi:hypothetical protein